MGPAAAWIAVRSRSLFGPATRPNPNFECRARKEALTTAPVERHSSGQGARWACATPLSGRGRPEPTDATQGSSVRYVALTPIGPRSDCRSIRRNGRPWTSLSYSDTPPIMANATPAKSDGCRTCGAAGGRFSELWKDGADAPYTSETSRRRRLDRGAIASLTACPQMHAGAPLTSVLCGAPPRTSLQ